MKNASLIFLLITGMLLRTTCAEGQLATDTICLPVDVVKRIMAAADSTPLLRERVDLVEQDKRTLAGIVKAFEGRDSLNAAIIGSYNKQIQAMAERGRLYDAELDNMRTLLKRERRKRTWLSIGGLAGIAAGIYLGTKL